MKIAIYGRPVNLHQVQLAETVIELLQKAGITMVVHDKYLPFLRQHLPGLKELPVFFNHDDIRSGVDFMFSIGGDGTLLDTICLVKDAGIPIVGINAGRLGFLSSVSKDNLETAMDSIFKGQITIEERSMLRLDSNKPLFQGENIALNDFTLHKKETSSMVTVHAYLNGDYLNSYWADGLLISTPTGSTGYSLSCGGPIIVPQSESFVITPIAPHNLNVRPIVVADRNVITLEVEGRGQHFMATLDSRSLTIDSSYQLSIRKAEYPARLVRLSNENFLNTLRKKLNWGLDTRN